MDSHRHERVAESIREELEEIIAYELSDPRIGDVSVSEAHISPDLRHAHIQLTLGGSEEAQKNTLDALEHAKHFLKQQLAERLQLFRTPELHFQSSLPATLAAKAPSILKRMKRGRPRE